MKKAHWFAGLSALWIGLTMAAAMAEPKLDPAVRALVEAKLRDGQFSSVVIGLTDGKTSHIEGFGRVGDKSPDQHTVYEIGSVTKTFTALLLAQMVTEKRISLDATVNPALKPISLLDLATQSSGLPRLPSNLKPQDMANPYADYGRKELDAFIASFKPSRAPGSQYEYSNLGFGVLAESLASLTGQSYGDMVQARIAKPLQMVSTGTTLSPAMAARLAKGHDAGSNPASNWDFDAIAGAGAIKSDAHDMLLYLQAMMAATGKPDNAYALVQTPQRATTMAGTRIALGWHISPMQGKNLVWHNGMTGGYASFVGFTDDGKQGVVVLANTARLVDPIAQASLFPQIAQPVRRVDVPAQVLEQYTGRYELAPGFVLAVSPTPTGLRVQATGQPPFAAVATAESEFAIEEVGATLSFKRTDKGSVDSVILHQGGRDIPGKRL